MENYPPPPLLKQKFIEKVYPKPIEVLVTPMLWAYCYAWSGLKKAPPPPPHPPSFRSVSARRARLDRIMRCRMQMDRVNDPRGRLCIWSRCRHICQLWASELTAKPASPNEGQSSESSSIVAEGWCLQLRASEGISGVANVYRVTHPPTPTLKFFLFFI